MNARIRAGALVLTLALPVVAFAQPPASPGAAVAELASLNANVAGAAGSGDNAVLTAMARRRAELLASLMDAAPAEVLRLALPTAVRDGLPPQAKAFTEEHVELAGTVEVSYEDHRTFSRLRHALETDAGRYSLHFAANMPDWLSGQQVRLRGVRLQAMLALDGSQTTTTSVPALPLASGEQRTLVILVNFRDKATTPYTTAHAADVVFTQTDGYFAENSGGRAWLTGDVYGWFTIAMDSTVCDTTTLANLAKAAAQGAGATLANYSRFLYAFPSNACTWWGLGSVGGNPSQAWVNGDMALEVAAHEIGHNFGLYHSRNMDCGAVPIGSSCTVDEYGDTLDIMGATRGHFNAFQKERLGWLDPSQIVTLTQADGATYVLEPYSSSSTGVKALKILKSTDPATGQRTFYYVEARRGLGYDSFMSTWANVMTGVAVHTGSESSGNSSYLLDMTPETASWYDPALGSSRTFVDGAAGLTLGSVSGGSAGASVTVSFNPPGGPTCTAAAPRVTLSPGAATAVAAGTAVTYTVSVTNLDSATCASATFSLAPSAPAGWAAALNASSLSLLPGATGSTTLSVSSSTSAVPGSYQVSVATSGASGTHSASGSATYSITAPRSVQLVSDRAAYLRSDTVTLTARVLSGTSPVAGVSVSFQIRKADGRAVNGSATTDAQGYANYRLRLKSRDPLGTWQATASAQGSTATASFAVNR